MPSESDRYDIVIFGATGFTGEFVVEEVALCAKDKSWAVSGRNKEKLTEMLRRVSDRTGLNLMNTPILVADVNDANSLALMAKKATVVVNCVGPYRFFGEQVVKACVENGASHVDISGEPQYLESMQLKYGEAAKEAGVFIVGSCGWDSIPIETGLIFARKKFAGELNSAETVVSTSYGPKGTKIHFGTLQSMIYGFLHRGELKDIRSALFPSALPKTPYKLSSRNLIFYHPGSNGYCLPFMGSDKSVVYRTQQFNYKFRKWRPIQVNTYWQASSLLEAFGLILWGIMFAIMTSFAFTRKLLEKYPEIFTFGAFSHDGPTREQLMETRFSYWIFANGWSTKKKDVEEQYVTPPDKKLTVRVDGPDPGYGCTSACLIAAALTILNDKELLPQPGVLTPGAAFAETNIIERLQSRGVTFTVVEGPTAI